MCGDPQAPTVPGLAALPLLGIGPVIHPLVSQWKCCYLICYQHFCYFLVILPCKTHLLMFRV